MISTAYLRVYQPASAFSEDESARWLAQGEDDESAPVTTASSRWLITSVLSDADAELAGDGALLRSVDGQVLVCPYRTRLRALAGLLAFRQTIPEEVAEAFVPEDVAHRAARELASLSDHRPEVRSHILHANWHVPLRWFAAFDGEERILVEDRGGLRIRYETRLGAARTRLSRALEILDRSGIDEEVALAVRELSGWVEDFDGDGLLELDYGGVAGMFPPDELVDDASAADVWVCLEALRAGDLMRAGRIFAELTERWSAARAFEVMN